MLVIAEKRCYRTTISIERCALSTCGPPHRLRSHSVWLSPSPSPPGDDETSEAGDGSSADAIRESVAVLQTAFVDC